MGIHVLYHDDADGYASALAAYLKFGDEATYKAVQYGQPFPLEVVFPDSKIYVLDFSYKREILDEVNLMVASLTVIDHHETSMQDLQGLEYAIFDMDKSGATLSWTYFHPEVEIPYMFKLVEDHDLWEFSISETRAFDLGMATSGKYSNIQFWHQVFKDSLLMQEIIERGKPLVAQQDGRIDSFFKKQHYKIVTINGHKVAVYNFTGNTFEISHYATAAMKRLDIDYVISYFFTETGKVALSYRSSRKTNIHVGNLCREQGGGGHRHAGGLGLELDEGLNWLQAIYSV